jgi:hypothetical protein
MPTRLFERSYLVEKLSVSENLPNPNPNSQGSFQTDHNELELRRGVFADVVGDPSDISIVESSVDFVQHEEWRRLIASGKITMSRVPNKVGRHPHLWIANSKARAAMVFSPPDNCSMSRKRFIGGIAWYLIPLRYGSCAPIDV